MKKQRFIMALLLVAGVYLPTSSNTIISTNLAKLNGVILLLLLVFLQLFRRKVDRIQFYLVTGICISMFLATLLTPFTDIKYGDSLYYLLLCLLFCLDLRDIYLTKYVQRIFTLVNVINIVICLGIVLKYQQILVFITQHYSAFYDDLMMYMLSAHKPVLTFGSHSVAGFFLYLFFYLNLQTYKVTDKIMNLSFSLLYMFFLLCLTSNTAFLYMVIALLQLLTYLFSYKRRLFYFCSLFGFVMYSIFNYPINDFFQSTFVKIQGIASSSTNGILGRYSSIGNLSSDITYITQHPFHPIGFGFSPDLFYGDSGLIEYLMRGSIVLVFCIYFGLIRFLTLNLHSKKTAYVLFGVIILFEIGFSGLIYFRTLYLLPFIVAYLNTLEKIKQKEVSIKNEENWEKIKLKWSA